MPPPRTKSNSLMPVFQRGAKLADMAEMKKVSDLIAVGGIAGRLRANADRSYLHQVVRAAGGHPLHLLGCGSQTILRRYRPYSSDSSSHATRQGQVWFWFGRRFHELKRDRAGVVRLNGKPVSKQRVLFARVCEIYGVDPVWTRERRFYGGEFSKVVNLRSYIRFQVEMRRVGVEYFVALNDSDRKNAVTAWEMEKGHADLHATA